MPTALRPATIWLPWKTLDMVDGDRKSPARTSRASGASLAIRSRSVAMRARPPFFPFSTGMMS